MTGDARRSSDQVEPTRVLWLIRGLGPGGAERLLVAHARARGEGWSYEVAYQVAAKDHLVPELVDAGVTVHRLGTGPRWPAELRRLVADRRIDIVHAHAPAMAAGARLALRLAGRRRPRLVYTEHNRWGAYRWPTRLANAVTFALDDATLAVSEETRRSVWGPFRRRVETLHHGIDRHALARRAGSPEDARRSLGLEDHHLVALHVANFRREKAHEVLVEAAKVATHPDLRILMVGQGQRFDEISRLVDEADLGERLQILGYREDVPALLAACDLVVLSSDHEGLPVAVMEALALGRPVVSTAVGGIPEAISDGVEGLLVPPRAPDLLAAALLRCCTDAELRRTLAAGARAGGQRFDAASATARVESIYRDVLAS